MMERAEGGLFSSTMKEESLWDVLSRKEEGPGKLPVFLYGTGNGGDKILAACERYHIDVAGVFASDGFVRNRTFHGMPVRSYADIRAEYGDDIVILLAFGTTLPEVRAFLSELDRRHTLYIPDVPLYGGDLFDGAYFDAHRAQLTYAVGLLSDERSRAIFEDAVNFRLSGKMRYLSNTSGNVEALREVFAGNQIEVVLDGGAYKGDSARDFIEALSPRTIFAVEGDARTAKKLADYAAEEDRCHVVPIHAALWDNIEERTYLSSASRGSGESGRNRRGKEVVVSCRTIDDIMVHEGDGYSVDLIKLDVEGAEMRALKGAERVLLADAPNLALSLYHRTDDLYELIAYVHEKLPRHRLYLRRADCVPLWDLTLYAVR